MAKGIDTEEIDTEETFAWLTNGRFQEENK